jgi:hypothetical protein
MSASKKGNTYAQNQPHSQKQKKIVVIDLKTGIRNTFDSMHKAAKAINCTHRNISLYFIRNQIKPYKGRYGFERV